MTTILHIEDDPLWAGIVRKTIRAFPDFRLLGSAATGLEGLARSRELSPQIVMLDLRLPDMDGIAAIDRLSELNPTPKILLFTARADDGVMIRLFSEPVAGLLWKSPAAKQELPRALTTIANGGKYYSADAQHAWHRFRAGKDSYFKIFTATEIKLLPLCAQGFSDEEIAANLGCKTATAHTHRKNIMAKTGLHSQVELHTWALKRGFFAPPLPAPPCLVAWTE